MCQMTPAPRVSTSRPWIAVLDRVREVGLAPVGDGPVRAPLILGKERQADGAAHARRPASDECVK